MSRPLLLILGAIAWSVVALDFAVHLVLGDLLVPLALATILVVWTGARRLQMRRLRHAEVEVTA
jgi:hypothetical protein